MPSSKFRTLDLFSGIGGNVYALSDVCKTVAYCEIDPVCRGILAANMERGKIHRAPIFEDVKTLTVAKLREANLEMPNAIVASFPCQDISSAGNGAGIQGERSSLWWQVLRLIDECKHVEMVLLENSPMIHYRGLRSIVRTLAQRGFVCRWGYFAARDCGAFHVRQRWYLLASKPGVRLAHVTSPPHAFANLSRVPRLIKRPESRIPLRHRMQRLGNSVVPQVTALAYNSLAGIRETSALPTFPSQIDSSMLYVYSSATKTSAAKKPPSSVKRNTPTLYVKVMGKTKELASWPTPVFNASHYYPNVAISCTRATRMIGNVMFLERETQRVFNPSGQSLRKLREQLYLNPRFVEHLMGYPADWTRS
jgi:site-specific DNA-cytosine methylase